MVGPEGSVLCFLVIGILWIVFDQFYPKSAIHGKDAHAPLPAKTGSSSLRFSE
jgi:hypothetical protein